MNLRKQLFAAFLMVAILPLIAVGIYMFGSNLMLAFDLHKQNLQNSTQIQADLVEEDINRLMVRARKFVSSQAVIEVCKNGIVQGGESATEFSHEILNFSDETLDNVAIFTLLNQKGEFIYSSGSNGDSQSLKANLPQSLQLKEQHVAEIPFTDGDNNLAIYTPVQVNGQSVGTFLLVLRTDYLLKIISSHRQLESSNAFIYCKEHQVVVTSKQAVSFKHAELDRNMKEKEQGSLSCAINGRQTLTYYQSLSKTPWVLVSTVSTGQIFNQVWNYGLINLSALLLVFLIIVILSRRQSRRMLYPLDQLLSAVEAFFLAGATEFPQAKIDPKSEIGYLAEKFSKLSDEITLAQGKIRESNYLYAALLKATFEFRLVIDFQSDKVECSSGNLSERLKNMPGKTASEHVLAFLAVESCETESEGILRRIANGSIKEPIEAEAYFSKDEHDKKNWYRVVAVPVIQGIDVCRVVLHFEDITEQKCEELRLIQSSQTDLLCGVYNKTAFPLHCKVSQDGRTDALFFIDLDNFKQVNDTLGHVAGDNVLVSTAHATRAQFRESDVVGRFGGDEFVVFAPGINKEMAEQKAKRLLETISFYLDTPKKTVIHVTASVGICMMQPPITLEQGIQLADEAMYQAKKNGRAQFYFTQTDEEE